MVSAFDCCDLGLVLKSLHDQILNERLHFLIKLVGVQNAFDYVLCISVAIYHHCDRSVSLVVNMA